MNWLKKYWLELLVFGAIFGIILTDLSPNFTWMMVDSDGPEYVMDAIYFYPAHHTSAPLYLLMGHVFEWLPFGTLYWRMSLMSGLFTMGSIIFIYLSALYLLRANKYQRYYAILAGLIFGGAALVLAQAIIVETYAVVTFFSIGAYYFSLKKKWYWCSAFLGMGLVTHHLILLTWLVLIFAHRELRNWKRLATTFAFLIFYLYMPISIHFTDQPNMWGNTTLGNFFTNNIAVFNLLVGKLAMYDLPKRIFDTLGILGISLGLALIPLGWWLWKHGGLKNELMWLFALSVIYWCSDMAPQVAKYMEASIAWGAIMAVLALSRLNKKWLTWGVTAVSCGLLIINGYLFDIGRTLDPELSATKFYEEELPKIADGQIFVTLQAWEWVEAFLYNKQHNRNIIPVCIGTLASEDYQDWLRGKGVNVESLMADVQPGKATAHELNVKQIMVTMSILRNNSDVWVSAYTTPETYGAIVVPAKGNEERVQRWIGEANVVPQWRFKPSNPYDIITGAIEIAEWNFILQSSHNCMLLFFGASLGFLGYVLLRQSIQGRREEKANGRERV